MPLPTNPVWTYRMGRSTLAVVLMTAVAIAIGPSQAEDLKGYAFEQSEFALNESCYDVSAAAKDNTTANNNLYFRYTWAGESIADVNQRTVPLTEIPLSSDLFKSGIRGGDELLGVRQPGHRTFLRFMDWDGFSNYLACVRVGADVELLYKHPGDSWGSAPGQFFVTTVRASPPTPADSREILRTPVTVSVLTAA